MRQGLRRFRARTMATRPEGRTRLSLPPRGRWIAGWIAAAAIIVGIALAVGILGSGGNGPPVGATPAATSPTGTGGAATVRFGTALDPATQEVAAEAETDRFVEDDTFAYSFRPDEPPPTTVWVEVRREADGSGEAVQEPAPHALAEDALVIAFSVPAAALFRDFGTGSFQMRIYLEEGGPVAASGAFELIVRERSPTPTEG